MSKYNLRIQYIGKKGYYYLDRFEGYSIDDDGKRKQRRRRESLKITLLKNPETPLEREENKKNKQLAERMVSERNNAKSKVKTPEYYNGKNNYTAVEVVDNFNLSYHLATACTYILRAYRKHKTPNSDIQKAIDHLTFELEKLEKNG